MLAVHGSNGPFTRPFDPHTITSTLPVRLSTNPRRRSDADVINTSRGSSYQLRQNIRQHRDERRPSVVSAVDADELRRATEMHLTLTNSSVKNNFEALSRRHELPLNDRFRPVNDDSTPSRQHLRRLQVVI